MKILIASDSYTYQTSGVSNVVMTQARDLRRMGHEVKVLAPSNRPHSFREGDDYYVASVPGLVYPDVRMGVMVRCPFVEELIAWHPDIAHLHTEAAMAVLARRVIRACGIPFVMTVHTDYAQFAFGRFRRSRPVARLFKTLGKGVYRNVGAVIAPSEKALGFAQLQGVRERVVIPNGIHLENYQKSCTPEEKAALFESLNLPDNGKTLAVISRISKEKNIREILEYLPGILKEEPEAHLLIVGDGPDRAHLETLARELGVTEAIRFTGRIPQDEVYRYYALGDLFVSASTFEVHSLTFLEAMARGLPLVCREDLSLKGVLEDGENGYIYRTEAEFDTAVLRLLRDEALRKRMGEEALRRVEDFTDEKQIERTLALYERLIQAKNPEP